MIRSAWRDLRHELPDRRGWSRIDVAAAVVLTSGCGAPPWGDGTFRARYRAGRTYVVASSGTDEHPFRGFRGTAAELRGIVAAVLAFDRAAH